MRPWASESVFESANAMTTHSRAMAETEHLEADVCIVGCGPAGIAIAAELISAGQSVVVLEAGGEDDTFDADLLRGVATGPILKRYEDYLVHSRRLGVGGAGAGWGRVGRPWLMPLCPADLEPREWVARSGWPLAYAELESYYSRAATFLGLPEMLRDKPVGSTSPDSLRTTRLVASAYQFPQGPGVLRERFAELVASPGLHVALHTVATDFDVVEDRVVGLRAVASGGAVVGVAARLYVLAAGGIENARLLLLNARERARCLTGTSPTVGRYFMEHPHVVAGTVVVPVSEFTEYLPAPAGSAAALRVLRLTDAIHRERGLLNASFQFAPVDGGAAGGSRSSLVTCDLFVRAEQEPSPSSFVTLGRDLDCLARPRPELRWSPTSLDWSSLVESAELVVDVLRTEFGWRAHQSISMGSPWPNTPADTATSSRPTWGHHHIGTTRIATTPERGSVDVDCRVFGTTNLFVAGSSVFPTGGCANPTFTIVALAIRLADHLRSLPSH